MDHFSHTMVRHNSLLLAIPSNQARHTPPMVQSDWIGATMVAVKNPIANLIETEQLRCGVQEECPASRVLSNIGAMSCLG